MCRPSRDLHACLQRRLHDAAATAVGCLEGSGEQLSEPGYPLRSQVGVEADLRADLHAFLSGTSDRLSEKLMAVRGTRRGAHLQPSIVRDRELAAGFFTHGPQALRRWSNDQSWAQRHPNNTAHWPEQHAAARRPPRARGPSTSCTEQPARAGSTVAGPDLEHHDADTDLVRGPAPV